MKNRTLAITLVLVAVLGLTFLATRPSTATPVSDTFAGGISGTVTRNALLKVNGDSKVADSSAVDVSGTMTIGSIVSPTGGIAAGGGFSIAPNMFHTGAAPAQVAGDGTDATPVATEVYIAQIYVPANCSITGVAVMNGSVASGNIKVGLANSAGAVVATSASTAMSGTDAYQRIDFTAPYAGKGPATYYVLEFVDNGTARINTHTFGNFRTAKQTGQVYATGFTTITVPTTFTTALGPIASLY